MIPHQPPMRFPVTEGQITVPPDHPMCRNGKLSSIAAIELAAQCAGMSLSCGAQGGMLVEIESAQLLQATVPDSPLTVSVVLVRQLGPLWRFRVECLGVFDVVLTLRLEAQ